MGVTYTLHRHRPVQLTQGPLHTPHQAASDRDTRRTPIRARHYRTASVDCTRHTTTFCASPYTPRPDSHFVVTTIVAAASPPPPLPTRTAQPPAAWDTPCPGATSHAHTASAPIRFAPNAQGSSTYVVTLRRDDAVYHDHATSSDLAYGTSWPGYLARGAHIQLAPHPSRP